MASHLWTEAGTIRVALIRCGEYSDSESRSLPMALFLRFAIRSNSLWQSMQSGLKVGQPFLASPDRWNSSGNALICLHFEHCRVSAPRGYSVSHRTKKFHIPCDQLVRCSSMAEDGSYVIQAPDCTWAVQQQIHLLVGCTLQIEDVNCVPPV